MKKKTHEVRPPWFDKKVHYRQKAIRFVIQFMGWIGIAIIYYIGFSFFFDTPIEYRMKRSTAMLKKEYEMLNNRYDSIQKVLDNVVERDRNVFRMLFEAEPYDFDGKFETSRFTTYENMLSKSNKGLGKDFFSKTQKVERELAELVNSNNELRDNAIAMGDKINYIPSIQPIINKDLTLLTTSYGMRVHPFYKSLVSHQGVDYAVPEGSRVFATADGVVKDIQNRSAAGGLIIVISHGNGYETEYRHLSKLEVSAGQRVKRGDIIALSGNTGLSLAPHLHYEVIHNDMRVDPIHYFFMELSPTQYQKMTKIAQSGMQSFD